MNLQTGIEPLDDAECRRLLTHADIGRLVYSEGALPAVAPVRFTVQGDRLLIPAQADSGVAAASRSAVVALEADDIDAVTGSGWNVTVIGPSHVVAEPGEVVRLDALGVRPWGRHDARCYIVVQAVLVRGCRFGPVP